jgi:hypothetical protein
MTLSIAIKHVVIAALLAYKGRLFKCPPISQLRPMAEKYGFLEDPDWEQYLKYAGLSFNASKEDFIEFFEKQWNPDPNLCTMCPSTPINQKNKNLYLTSLTTIKGYLLLPLKTGIVIYKHRR